MAHIHVRDLVTATLIGALLVAAPAPAAGDKTSDSDSNENRGTLERAKKKITGEETDRERNPVKAAQRVLRDRGYDPGPVDGNLGAKTRTAVKEFQKAEGLKVTGRLDADTMARLRRGEGSASPAAATKSR